MDSRATNLQAEIRQTRPFRSRAQEATIAILRTADLIRRRFATVVEPHGITLQQYNVLRILRGADGRPLPTLEIADRLIERTPGITRLLDRLEEKGLVRRERSTEDRRQVNVAVTEAGLDLLARLDAAVDEADERSTRTLENDDLDRLLHLLERVRSAEP